MSLIEEIILLRGTEFSHILPEHQEAFQQDVLNQYFECAETNTFQFYGIPCILDLLHQVNPLYHLAGLYGYFEDNPYAFYDKTRNMTEEEKETFLEQLHKMFYNEDYLMFGRGQNESLLHEDIALVLNIYHVVFIDAEPQFFNYLPRYVIQNSPIQEVW